MRRIFFSLLLLCMFITFSTPMFSHASRYPDAARALAGDGFSRRQNGSIARISRESMGANKLGFQAYQQKDYKVAIGQFDRAIELDKNNMFARFNLAQSPADASMMDEGEARKDGLLMMSFTRDRAGKIGEVSREF
jgi:tetratricopeptide (TPR) repeat protein